MTDIIIFQDYFIFCEKDNFQIRKIGTVAKLDVIFKTCDDAKKYILELQGGKLGKY